MSERISRKPGDLLIEALAIVASILLAFAIDAWWDERQVRTEEQETLRALQVEFNQNLSQAREVLDQHQQSVEVISRFLGMDEAEIRSLPVDEVSVIVRFFANPRTFDPLKSSLDALVGSGKLGLIRDRRLREALTNFENLLEDAVEDRWYLSQTSLQVWYEMAREGGPWRRPVDDRPEVDCAAPDPHRSCFIDEWLSFLPEVQTEDLIRMRANQALIGYVKQNKINAVRYASEVNQLIYQVEQVLLLIDENLDKR